MTRTSPSGSCCKGISAGAAQPSLLLHRCLIALRQLSSGSPSSLFSLPIHCLWGDSEADPCYGFTAVLALPGVSFCHPS